MTKPSRPPRISHRTWTLPDLLAEHRAGRLLLPVMQREWSWSWTASQLAELEQAAETFAAPTP